MFCHWFSFLSLDRPVRTGFVFRQDYLDMLYLLSLLNDFYIHFSFFLYNYSFCILYFYTSCFLPCLFDSVLNTFLSMFRSCCFWCMSFLYVYYNRSFVLCNCFFDNSYLCNNCFSPTVLSVCRIELLVNYNHVNNMNYFSILWENVQGRKNW